VPVWRDGGTRIVSVRDNYDRLRYPPHAVTRDRRYTRYLGDGRMLRSHTTAHVPALLDRLAADAGPGEVLLSVPGICYRRDVIDRQHVGEPHQIDLWLVRRSRPALVEGDLVRMIALVVAAVRPGVSWRTVPGPHPYTLSGREIRAAGTEIGECGLAHPDVLRDAGLPESASGLAMGLGLDRLVMLAKGIDDIRLLRETDPRVARQMADLDRYRSVSPMPLMRRDLSLAVASTMDAELLGDRAREILGHAAESIEEIEILSETPHDDLPDSARVRAGILPWHKNVLVRLVLRHPTRTLTSGEANAIRDRVYAGLHEGRAHEWASR
jgi:phenylalanyl-tRNA synthetase alpha chain